MRTNCLPVTGTSLDPHTRVPRTMPKAPTLRRGYPMGAVAVTMLFLWMWYMMEYMPHDERTLFAA